MTHDRDLSELERRFLAACRQPPRLIRWYRPGATGLERWTRQALDGPRHALDRLPGRLACRLLRRHNWTCVGLPEPHPARW